MMHIVPWNEKLTTGIELLDSQHRDFLINSNRFIIRVRAKKEIEASKEQLDYLTHFLMIHFQVEETFMVESGFPDYLHHQAIHKHLKFKVQEMTTILKEQDFSPSAIEQFCQFVNEWVVGHILKEDIDFAQYYIKHKNETEPKK